VHDVKSITKMDYPPYSPDLAFCDFRLFQKLKNAQKEQRFADIPDIQCKVMLVPSIVKNDFQECFWQWHRCLTKCIVSQGEYFEGSNNC
jgi:hypothetical protein